MGEMGGGEGGGGSGGGGSGSGHGQLDCVEFVGWMAGSDGCRYVCSTIRVKAMVSRCFTKNKLCTSSTRLASAWRGRQDIVRYDSFFRIRKVVVIQNGSTVFLFSLS